MIDPFCPIPNIDFDAWRALADTDPEAFEEERKKLVDQVIKQAPEDRQQRLRRLQWRIDRVREISHTPMAACLKISKMMWDSVLGPAGLLESLQEVSQQNPQPMAKKYPGNVLPFPEKEGNLKAGL